MSNETLSALIDGECSDAELDRLLEQMDRDPGLALRWSRWHLQQELADGVNADPQTCICAGVMSRLEEPVATGRVVDLAAWSRRLVALPWKPAIGFAAAASMGAAAVLFLGPRARLDSGIQETVPEGYATGVRVSSPIAAGLRGGRLQTVSLTGDNPGPTFADEEYAALLRGYIAGRNSVLAEQAADAANGSSPIRYAGLYATDGR